MSELEKLPHGIKEKFDVLKQKFTNIDGTILLQLCPKVHFLVDSPTFTFTWIEDSKLQMKHVSANTQTLSSVINSMHDGNLFAIYSIDGIYIRGSYVKDWEGYHAKIRDEKINEIISE